MMQLKRLKISLEMRMCFKAHSFILAKNFAIDQIQSFLYKNTPFI
ncbi:hypothetical protein DBQ04_01835 [Lactobacillus acidophilus]|uniref:Uncharacterized protein citG n=1 Tax=Lactobacillus acidophilus (strain ATCC 700396 / NCK56 / N2 / NCFM) TaxID=272621 RepID=Q5FKJ9_LACAC|nr:hypothetical protein LBA0918 [Lactobacillus acidophilus NCFM]KAB1966706.1 hypothetical protein F8247_01495 [Lactobacillus acidophilus]MBO8211113.1 hypothetical protein [Lactobacillus acidophilus]MCT3593576.1 hypothetical protein [Lactobacillus acidophilus]MCT3603715.1 hypothetical protein [Lactobacillus acidophilus]